MQKMPNTTEYFGNAVRNAINFRKKDFKLNLKDPLCPVIKYFRFHTMLNPFEAKDAEILERNQIIASNQIINYIQNN
jgi:hypothetical protein